MPTLSETLRLRSLENIQAGGPGSGRHKDFTKADHDAFKKQVSSWKKELAKRRDLSPRSRDSELVNRIMPWNKGQAEIDHLKGVIEHTKDPIAKEHLTRVHSTLTQEDGKTFDHYSNLGSAHASLKKAEYESPGITAKLAPALTTWIKSTPASRDDDEPSDLEGGGVGSGRHSSPYSYRSTNHQPRGWRPGGAKEKRGITALKDNNGNFYHGYGCAGNNRVVPTDYAPKHAPCAGCGLRLDALDGSARILKSAAYKLAGKIKFQGMPISIETKKGQIRKGVGADGKPWSVRMPWDYGYFLKTKAADGQHIDCFIGPNKTADYVYVVHQKKEKGKGYDEDKCFMGFLSANSAMEAYKSAYVGVDLFHSMSVLPIQEFRSKIYKTKNKSKQLKIHAKTKLQRRKLGNRPKVKAQYDGDYYQQSEKGAIQPLSHFHPPSLKNPIRVPADNPGDAEDKYGDRKKRRSKKNLKDIVDQVLRQTGKPEVVQTTLFVPMSQG